MDSLFNSSFARCASANRTGASQDNILKTVAEHIKISLAATVVFRIATNSLLKSVQNLPVL
jgi:hypothetical protein